MLYFRRLQGVASLVSLPCFARRSADRRADVARRPAVSQQRVPLLFEPCCDVPPLDGQFNSLDDRQDVRLAMVEPPPRPPPPRPPPPRSNARLAAASSPSQHPQSRLGRFAQLAVGVGRGVRRVGSQLLSPNANAAASPALSSAAAESSRAPAQAQNRNSLSPLSPPDPFAPVNMSLAGRQDYEDRLARVSPIEEEVQRILRTPDTLAADLAQIENDCIEIEERRRRARDEAAERERLEREDRRRRRDDDRRRRDDEAQRRRDDEAQRRLDDDEYDRQLADEARQRADRRRNRHVTVSPDHEFGADPHVLRITNVQSPAADSDTSSESAARQNSSPAIPNFFDLRAFPPAGPNGIVPFSGKTDSSGQLPRSFSDWQRWEFEYTMRLRYVKAVFWRDALARYLTDSAKRTYQRLLCADDGTFRAISYEQLTAELQEAFDMTITTSVALHELTRFPYKEGRPVSAIEEEIRCLAETAFPRHVVGNPTHKAAVMYDAFMGALPDRFRDKLLLGPTPRDDFEAAVKAARQIEADDRRYGHYDEDDEAPETPTMGDGGATYRAALEMNDDARSEEAGHAMANRDHAHARLFAAVKKCFHDGMSSLRADVASAIAARNAAAAQLVASPPPPPAPRQADCSAVTVSFGAAHRSSRNHRWQRSLAPPTRAPPSVARYFASPTGQAVHFVNPAERVHFYEILATRGTSESGLFIRPSGEGETGVLTQRRPLRSLRHSMRKNGSLRVDYAGCVLVHKVALAESEIPLIVGPEKTISKAKIDSACSLTCMPLCTADALGLRIEQPADLSISNVSGQPMTIVGKALVPLSIAGHCFEQPFIVTSDEAIKNHGIILGVDFIKRARLFQDYENGSAYVHGPPGIGSPVLMGVEPLRAADGQLCAGISAISARKNAPPSQSNESSQNRRPLRACTLARADAPIGGERDVKMEATAPPVRRLTGRADAQQGAANELVGKVQRRRSRLLADAPTVCVPRRANYLADEASERYLRADVCTLHNCADAGALHSRAKVCTLHSCADSESVRKTGACRGRLASLLSLCQVRQVPTVSDEWQWTRTRKRMDGSCSTSETAMDARNDASSTADGDEQRGKLHGSHGRAYSADSATTQPDRRLGDGAKLDSFPSRPSNDVALPPERFAQL